jgi:hypothetical protein
MNIDTNVLEALALLERGDRQHAHAIVRRIRRERDMSASIRCGRSV